MTLYAAFASNLDPNLMAERCPYSPLRGTGWIAGWRLTFGGEELGWEGAMATVVEDPADPTNQVFVALYDIHPKDVERLDEWEWFDQGVTLLHSFWDYEAERAFRWCLKLEPENAMVYWGLARATASAGPRCEIPDPPSGL